MNLTKSQRKVYLIDIGLWVLLMMKLTKIIMGIKIMKIKDFNLPSICVSICFFIIAYWLQYDIDVINKMNIYQIIFNFSEITIVGGFSIVLLYMITFMKGNKFNLLMLRLYGAVIVIYGWVSFCNTATSDAYHVFGNIIYLGIIFAWVNIIFGLFFIYGNFED